MRDDLIAWFLQWSDQVDSCSLMSSPLTRNVLAVSFRSPSFVTSLMDHPYNSKHLPQIRYHWISQADYLLCMLKETQTQIHEPFITLANQNVTSKRRIELLYAVWIFGCSSLRKEHIILVGIRTNIFLFNYLLATTQRNSYGILD